MTDEIEITSREAVERLAFMLERDAEDQNFQPCEMTGLSPDDEHTIAATLRALLARAEAAESTLEKDRIERDAMIEQIRNSVALHDEMRAKLAAARETLEQIEAVDHGHAGRMAMAALALLDALDPAAVARAAQKERGS